MKYQTSQTSSPSRTHAQIDQFFKFAKKGKKMFPLQLTTQVSEVDIPEEEETEEEAEEVVDEAVLAVNEDISQCFELFDKTESGLFEVKYLQKALKCLGIFLTETELSDLEQTLSKNGMVPFDPFKAYAFDKIMEMDQFDALKSAFHAFDPENEGLLPSDRFKKWMMTLGNPLTEKEAKELTKLGDPANKGFIVYDDLVGVLLSN